MLSAQSGFVAGALLNLSDLINARRLFALSAFSGAIVNAFLALTSHEVTPAVAKPITTKATP